MGDFKGALRAALLACTFFCSAASLAAAQTAPTVPTTGVPSREELDPSRRAPDIEQQRAREADLFARPESGPCPLANSALSFTLQSVTFNGATAATPEELASTYAGLLGRNVPVSTICEIRDRASDLFFSRGVLARVEIPEQRIEEGRLVLEVIEARVASVRVRGDAGPAQARVEGYLEQLRGLAPFDLQTAQRYLLLASDVPGVQLQAAIRPSAAGRGAVDLEVTLGRDEIDILVNVQNYGSESIGRWGGLLRADFNGFTPFGERSSLILYSTLDSDEQRIIQLIEEARVGDTGLLARGSFAYAKTKPGGELAALGLESDSVVAALEASYPLLRSRRRNLNLVGGFEYVDQETVFGSGPVLSDDKLRIISGRLEGSLRRPGLLAIDGSGGIEVRKGLDVFGASQAGEPTLTRTEGQPTATVWRFDGRVDAALPARIGAGFAVQAQYADEPLLSYEQLAIGNLTIGRGYDPSSVSGDRGVAASFELRSGPFTPASWLQVSGYGFYDVARIEDLSTGGEERTVASAGAGLRFRVSYGTRQFNVDLAYAEPLDKALSQAPSKPPSRLLLNVTAALY